MNSAANNPNPESPPLVLIVDDYKQNLQVLGQNLERAGYDVAIANSGIQALEKVNSVNPDLILLDIMMPGMDGFEVCRNLKSDPKTKEIPVIFLTARTQSEDVLQGFELGAVDYILKPFRPPELLARVRTHVDLKRTRERLVELNASKDRFFSIISHDMRSAMAGIVSYIGMARQSLRNSSAEDLEEDFETLSQSAQRLRRLMDNLLDWATIQRGAMTWNPVDLSVSDVAASAIEAFRSNLDQKQLRVDVKISPEYYIHADPDMVETIIRNLIGNAIKFSNPLGRVGISASEAGRHIEIEVRDDGVGIPAERLERLFRIDQNVSTPGTQDEKGAGLGLVLCHELIRRNGGEIEVNSHPGRGSSFTVTFPKAVIELNPTESET